MPSPLTIDDFKPFSVTCELRYQNAYLLYDRTGQILEDLRTHFSDLEVSNASPAQTAFTAEEGSFTLELTACRVTTPSAEKGGERFAKHCKTFFEVVATQLEINVYKRIGLRYIARRDYKDEDEAKTAVAALALTSLKPA